MKCQSLFSWKNKKNIVHLLSAEFVQRVVMVNKISDMITTKHITYILLGFHPQMNSNKKK